jgi:ABC-type branched-chain amino acid transport system, permease component
MKQTNIRWWQVVLLGAALVTATLRATPFQTTVLTKGVIWAILAMSVWFLLCVCDRASLGHAAFFGISAYATGIAITRWEYTNFWLILGLAIAVSTVAGGIVAIVAGRLNDVHFLLVTLAFAEMLRSLTTRWRELGGDDGLTGVIRPSMWPVPLDLSDPQNLLWACLGGLAIVVALLAVVVRSPFGAVLLGLRDSETRMAALGYSPFAYRTAGFVLSAAIAAVAGVMNALLTRFVSPSELTALVSARALLIVVIGSSLAMLGPVVVAIALTVVEDQLSSHTKNWAGILGVMYVIIAMFRNTPWKNLARRVSGGRWGAMREAAPVEVRPLVLEES